MVAPDLRILELTVPTISFTILCCTLLSNDTKVRHWSISSRVWAESLSRLQRGAYWVKT